MDIKSHGVDFEPQKISTQEDENIFSGVLADIMALESISIFSEDELKFSSFVGECDSTSKFREYVLENDISDDFLSEYITNLTEMIFRREPQRDRDEGSRPVETNFAAIAERTKEIRPRKAKINFM